MKTSAWIRSDPALLRRLLQNLVSNAIKYTPAGKVLVGCRLRRGNVLIEVADTGIGIAERDQRNIFTEFRRLNDGARQAPGLGLGLVDRRAHRAGPRPRRVAALDTGQGHALHRERAARRLPARRSPRRQDRDRASQPSGSRA